MALGCDALPGRHAVVVGDSTGRVHLIDPRLPLGDPIAELQLHKRGTKVASVQAHPLDPSVVMTSGNDHCARLFDVRALSSMRPPPAAAAPPAVPPPPPPRHQLDVSAGAVFDVGSSAAAAALSPSPTATPAPSTSAAAAGGNGAAAGAASSSAPKRQPPAQPHRAELAVMSHTRVVNSAYFSPLTGSKVLTTCQDNRLRVWDNWLSCGTAPPDREIVHSHDFNR